MIIENILYFLVILTVIIAIHSLYNSVIYKQFGKWKWIKFISFLILFIAAGVGLIFLVKYFVNLTIIRSICKFIDAIFYAFFKYVPLPIFVVWFILPIAVISIIFAIKTIKEMVSNRIKFHNWEKKHQPELVLEESGDNVESENDQFNLAGTSFSEFNYQSILGLQKAYELSKAKGLQVSKKDDGFVAVYAESQGLNNLESLLNSNDISFDPLPKRPALVVIQPEGIKAVTIKEALENLKGNNK